MNKKSLLVLIPLLVIILIITGLYYLKDNNSEDLDGEGVTEETFPPPNCNVLTNNTIPLKDNQTFLDTSYTEVTLTSRESWDKSRLPQQVTELEGKNYTCYPMPFEIEPGTDTPGMNIQPEVKKVEWTCELEYSEYRYLEKDKLKEKGQLVKQGFSCKKQNCEENSGEENYVWLCTKD